MKPTDADLQRALRYIRECGRDLRAPDEDTMLAGLIAEVKAETIERCALRVEEHNDDELCGWWFAEHIRTMKP